jgi:hypothetical protein
MQVRARTNRRSTAVPILASDGRPRTGSSCERPGQPLLLSLRGNRHEREIPRQADLTGKGTGAASRLVLWLALIPKGGRPDRGSLQ